jgi:hypothetical protein
MTVREKVDEIQRQALLDIPIFVSDKWERAGQRIADPEMIYLAAGDLQAYYSECDKRERAAGIKPAEMAFDYCPALVAERDQTKAEWLVIKEMARILGEIKPEEMSDRLLCAKNGLETRQRFIDLTVGLVVNLPDFVNPLTGKPA